MAIYRAPVAETEFILRRVLKIDGYGNLPGFAEATGDLVGAVLGEAARIAEEVVQPLNATGDREGCRIEGGKVTTPAGFGEAYRQLREGGWVGLTASADYGGQGLPQFLGASFSEFMTAANMAFAMYPGLSMGAYAALARHASDELKAIYLPKLASGEWTGTMNLTEAHCGTDLGLLRTAAKPQGDGSYKITGTKIFISAGEHDLADNIVHLVLARIEGAPEGTRGISLFVVPKFLPGPDGAPGPRNAVECRSLERKMGIHANATCVMDYAGATGWLVGEEHRGLAAMFTMMNEARLGVGIQGLALSEAAYQNAAAYARERLQGRALSGPAVPDKPADPLIVHPDVRRILMDIRAFNVAARALVLWTSLKASVARGPDEKEARAAEDHLGLVTPVIKGVLTDMGFANTVAAQQVFGGHGYIADTGMEQFVRDARIAMIYEGANGIQALDLVGRKLPRDGGRALMAFFAEVDGAIGEAAARDKTKPFAESLKRARDDLEAATTWFMSNALGRPDNAGAGATDYMHLFGLVALGLMWARIALACAEAQAADGLAADRVAAGGPDGEIAKTYLALGRHFIARALPESATRLARVRAGADTVMALPAEAF